MQHNIIIDTEGTTHDPSVLHGTSQIHVSRQAKTDASQSSRGAIDVRNAFKAHINLLKPTGHVMHQQV